MTRNRFLKPGLIACAATLVVLAGSAQAALVINKDTVNNIQQAPGLTGFATTGAMMTGLSITATFTNQAAQTRLWATTGATSGGVTGTGWGLSLTGDTFGASWDFAINQQANLGQLVSLVIDGGNALTILDTTDPNQGTPNSASGMDFAFNSCSGCDAVASYDFVVGIIPNAPVGDLFQRLTVNFVTPAGGLGGPRSNWSFFQDTDNDARFTVPEPGGLALVGLALAAAGLASRRRRRA